MSLRRIGAFRFCVELAPLIMSLRLVFLAVGIFSAAAVLMFVGGFGEIELKVEGQCGVSSYLCDPPTANRDEKDHAGPRVERRVGARQVP